ncbi:MAG TPA: ROK family protein, partial [Mycobacterium sp.]|nr:ROK family protein [Mycobacterium sp.]
MTGTDPTAQAAAAADGSRPQRRGFGVDVGGSGIKGGVV